MGFDWPNSKAYRVLTARGVIEISRHVAFDESAPPACDSRADFSPFLQTEVSVPTPAPVTPEAPASSAKAPSEVPTTQPSIFL
jgi:hypothetical protein